MKLLDASLARPPVHLWAADALVCGVALALLAAVLLHLHAFDSGLTGSDEASHFLNSYLIWSYLTQALGHNPLTYATDFYVHYPKISIGHWPPLYYVFLSVFFFVLPHTPWPFLLVNLVVGVLPVWLIARVVRQTAGWPWALLAGCAFVLMPMSINNTTRLMLDQVLGGLCLLAALLWSRYTTQPSLQRGLAFAAVTAAAILVKGNGWVLALFPFIHIALTKRWSVLTNWRSYAAAAAVLAVVGAWTLVTYKISSDGFNYAWGWAYFSKSMPLFLQALYVNLGPVGTLAALVGTVGSVLATQNPVLREAGRTALALVLATVLFHALVPVDIDPRYMSSAMPSLTILMALGAWMLAQRLSRTLARQWWLPSIVLVLFAVPGALFLRDRMPRYDLRMDQVATVIAAQPGSVVVVDGHSGTEGSLAVEVALRDPARQDYVVRSSQLLTDSDFMGKSYALRVASPQAVLDMLDAIGSNIVVVAQGTEITPRFPHSDLLLAAMRLPTSQFKLVHTYPHLRAEGQTDVYLRSLPIRSQPEAVKRVSFAKKLPQ